LLDENRDLLAPVAQATGNEPQVLLSAATVAVGDGEEDVQLLDRRPSIASNAGSAALVLVGKAAIAFMASIVFTRSVGPAGRGEIVFVYSTAGMLVLLAGAGTASALVRLRHVGGHTAAELYTSAVIASVIHGLVAMVIFGIAWAILRDSAFDGVGPGLALVVAALVGPLLLHQNLMQVAALHDRLGRTAASSLVGSSLYLVLVVGAAVTGRLSAPVVIGAFGAGSVLTPVLMVWPFRAVQLSRAGIRPVLRVLLRASWAANVAAMAVLLLWRVDVLLVKALCGYADLGRYSAATSIAEIGFLVVGTFRMALLPRHGSGGDRADLGAAIARVVRVALAVGLLGALVLAAVGRPVLVAVYGADFGEASTALAVLAPGVVLLGLQYPLFDALYASGEGRRLVFVGVAALTFEVGADSRRSCRSGSRPTTGPAC
jgi:O-antigen/teichoic acid export membrane protein